MTDPYAGPSDAGEQTVPLVPGGDQTMPLPVGVPLAEDSHTIPLVPDAGFAPAAPQPLPEETLLDPLAPVDPWASGPGLGSAAASPVAPVPPPAPSSAPSLTPQPTPAWGYPQPGGYASPTGGGFPPQPAGYAPQSAAQAAYAPTPGPAAWPHPATPTWERPAPAARPAPPAAGPGGWEEGFPEPVGPAANIPAQPYAPSPYAGQQWPATIEDPVAYNYGYNRGFDAATDHPNAVPSLVMGIIGLAFFSPLAPFAWYMAAKGQREARLDPGRWRTGGTIVAGKVLGIIGTALLALVTGFFVLIFLLMAATGI